MRPILVLILLINLICLNLNAQDDDDIIRYFIQADSSYVIVDNSMNNWFTLEIKADTLFQNEDGMLVYNDKKLLQINVLPFSQFVYTRKSITIPKALKAYKNWELDYHQGLLNTRLENRDEFYYINDKPFQIWWFKNPPEKESSDLDSLYESESNEIVDTFDVTHMLYLNFSIYAKKNVVITIPVYDDENLEEEIEKIKSIAHSLRVYAGPVDINVLFDKVNSKEKYFVRDSLGLLKAEVPEWANVLQPFYENAFFASFPEYNNVTNAMILRWSYKSDSLSYDDYLNLIKEPHELRDNYRLIEKNDTTYRYFYTSENGQFYHKCVFLRGTDIFCLLVFTATRDTYDYNISRFDKFIENVNLK